ncbi:hypothetical protein WP50_01260, partial [Lactiplantibacillus plantarum]
VINNVDRRYHKREGFVRVRVCGDFPSISATFELNKSQQPTIEIVIDRIVVKSGDRSRLFDSFEAALRLSGGYAIADVIGGEPIMFSEHYACPICGFTVGELEPRLFSFNAPQGACPDCEGLGIKLEVDEDLVVPDKSLTLAEGALAPWNPISSQYYPEMLKQACEQLEIPMDVPYEDLSKADQQTVLYGSNGKTFHFHYQNDFGGVRDVDAVFEGVINNVDRRYHETNSDFTRDVMRKYMTELTCQTCHGFRLNRKALSVKVGGEHIGSPIVRQKKGEHKKIFEKIKREGFVRVRVDGDIHDISETFELNKNQQHTIEIVIDRIVVKSGDRSRLFDSFEAALRLSGGYAIADVIGGEPIMFSEHYACPICGFTVGELEPRLFSFNAPQGACPDCEGLGIKLEVDEDLVVPDKSLTLAEGALAPWNPISSQYYPEMLKQACEQLEIPMDVPYEDLSKADQQTVLYGSNGKTFHFHYQNDFGGVRDVDAVFEGVINNVDRRYHKREGFVRVRVDGDIHDISETFELNKNQQHTIEIVIDRIVVKSGDRSRLFDSFEAALRLSGGYAIADVIGGEPIMFSEHYACPICGFTVGELEPRLFSFNAPQGACPDCEGLGIKLEVDEDLVVPDKSLTLAEGALAPWNPISSQYYPEMLKQACEQLEIPMYVPYEDLSTADQQTVLYGSNGKTFNFQYKNDLGGVRDVD